MMEMETKRLFIGGLFADIAETELKERLGKFGDVSNLELKTRKSVEGEPVKTFAHFDLLSTPDKLKKCMTTYNGSKWKGSTLSIQIAKENFLDRLQKERVALEQKKQDLNSPGETKKPKDITVPGSKPGDPVPGEENWVIGKLGRALPIVHMRRKDGKKIMTVDPSKYCHNLKVIKDTPAKTSVDQLTWEMEEKDSEIQKKQMGVFPASKKKKRKSLISSVDREYVRQVEEAEKSRLEDFEVVSTRKVKMLESREDCDSDDTDEIIAMKRPRLNKGMNGDSANRSSRKTEMETSDYSENERMNVLSRKSSIVQNNGANSDSDASTDIDDILTRIQKEPTPKRKNVKRLHSKPASSSSDEEMGSMMQSKKHMKVVGVGSDDVSMTPGPDVLNDSKKVKKKQKSAKKKKEKATVGVQNESVGLNSSDEELETAEKFSEPKQGNVSWTKPVKKMKISSKDVVSFDDEGGIVDRRYDSDDDDSAGSADTDELFSRMKKPDVSISKSNSSGKLSKVTTPCLPSASKVKTGSKCSSINTSIFDEFASGLEDFTTPGSSSKQSDSSDSESESDSDNQEKMVVLGSRSTDVGKKQTNLTVNESKVGKTDSVSKRQMLQTSTTTSSDSDNEFFSCESESESAESDASDADSDESVGSESRIGSKSSLSKAEDTNVLNDQNGSSDSDVNVDVDVELASSESETAIPSIVPLSKPNKPSISHPKSKSSDSESDEDEASVSCDSDSNKLSSGGLSKSSDPKMNASDSDSDENDDYSDYSDADSVEPSPSSVSKSDKLKPFDAKSDSSDSDSDDDNVSDSVSRTPSGKSVSKVEKARTETDQKYNSSDSDSESDYDKDEEDDDDDDDDNETDSNFGTPSQGPVSKAQETRTQKNQKLDSSDSDSDVSEESDSSDSDSKNPPSKAKLDKPLASTTKQGSKDPVPDDDDEEEEEVKSVKKESPLKLAGDQEASAKSKKEKKKSKEKSVKNVSKVEKHKSDNQKRMESFQQRMQESQSQKTAIREALAAVDSGRTKSKKIVFSSDSEDDDATPVNSSQITEKMKPVSIPEPKESSVESKKAMGLFDSDSEEEMEVGQDDEEMFRIRPQYEGTAGKKLLKLQRRYGDDERFKMDEKFLDSDSDDETMKQVPSQPVAEKSERDRQMDVLKDMFGSRGVANKNPKQAKFQNVSSVHFDPTRDDHSQFEVQAEPKKSEKKKKKKKKKTDEEDDEMEVEKKTKETEVPEVSKERFYEVTSNLKDVFQGSSENATFSFLTSGVGGMDVDTQESNDKDIPEPEACKSTNLLPWQAETFTYDTSSGSEEEDDRASKQEQVERESKTDTANSKLFFFMWDDDKIKEGVESFYRKEDLSVVRQEWWEKRLALIDGYKLRRKRALRKQRLERVPQHQKTKGKWK